MPARIIALFVLALAAAPVFADQITAVADGVIEHSGNLVFLRVGSTRYLLKFPTDEMHRFALALNDKSVHVEGSLRTIPEGRAGAGTVYIRPEVLIQGGEGGYDGVETRYGISQRKNHYPGGTYVFPKYQTGRIPSFPRQQ